MAFESLRAVADNPARESIRECVSFLTRAEPRCHRELPMPVTQWKRGVSACLWKRPTFWQQKAFAVQLMLVLAGCTAGSGEGLDQNGQPIPISRRAIPTSRNPGHHIHPICTQCHIGANAPQECGRRGQQLRNARERRERDADPAAREPGQSGPELHRAQDPGQCGGGRAHALHGARRRSRPDSQLDRAGAQPASVASNSLTVGSSIPPPAKLRPQAWANSR
jgi:hypothetical protein